MMTEAPPIDGRRWRSPNHDGRGGREATILVLHYTGMTSGEAALARLCDAGARVSAHYVVEEDGRIFQLVDEERRAWHAGRGSWRGIDDVNAASIGIEIVNPGHEFGYRPFPAAQMAAAARLAEGILGRHPIPARNVIGHSDMAPDRKTDPGELFDWPWLAARGIGLWPEGPDPVPVGAGAAEVRAALAAYGYGLDPGADAPVLALKAFQRHFRPARVDGVADLETRGLLKRLLNMTAARYTP